MMKTGRLSGHLTTLAGQLAIAVSIALSVISLLGIALAAGAAAQTVLTLGTWAGPESATGIRLQQLADGFNRSQSEYSVVIQQIASYNDAIVTRLATGTGPDIILVRNEEVHTLGDFLVDLRPYLAKSALDKDAFIPGLFDGGGDRVVRMAGTFGLLNLVIFYRPSMFERAGLPGPVQLHKDGSWDWDGLVEAAKRLTVDADGDGAPEQFGIWLWDGEIHRMLARQNGGHFIAPDGSAYLGDQPEYTDAIQWAADLFYVHGVRANVDFDQGNVAMATWPIERRTLMRTLGWDWGVAPLFNKAEGRPFLDLTGNGFAITTNSQHPDGAWAFIEWALGEEAQLMIASQGALPGRTSALQSPEFLNEPGVSDVPYTVDVLLGQYGVFPFGEGGGIGVTPEINRLYLEALYQVERGEKPASVAFAEIREPITAMLSALRR